MSFLWFIVGFLCFSPPLGKLCFGRPTGFNFTLDLNDVEMQENNVWDVGMAIGVECLRALGVCWHWLEICAVSY